MGKTDPFTDDVEAARLRAICAHVARGMATPASSVKESGSVSYLEGAPPSTIMNDAGRQKVPQRAREPVSSIGFLLTSEV
jgi:hypothetical protein